MNESILLSRKFVEFGPFSLGEIKDFYRRGLLRDSDYVNSGMGGSWIHVDEWAAGLGDESSATGNGADAPTSEPAQQPAKKRTTKKAATASANDGAVPKKAAKKAGAKKPT